MDVAKAGNVMPDIICKNELIYRFKTSYNISYNHEYFCCSGRGVVNLYSVKNGQLKTTIRGIRHPVYTRFIDDKTLLVKNTLGEYHTIDIQTQETIRKYKLTSRDAQDSKFALTPDNKYIVDFLYVFPREKLIILSANFEGHKLWDLEHATVGQVFFDNDKSLFYIATNCRPEPDQINRADAHYTAFYSLKYPFDGTPPQKMEIPRKVAVPEWNTPQYIDFNNKFVIKRGGGILLYDVETNETEEFISPSQNYGNYINRIKWSKNGMYIAAVGNKKVLIFDVTSRSCIKEYEVEYGCFVDFYDNDTKLLIGTWKNGYCVELHSAKTSSQKN